MTNKSLLELYEMHEGKVSDKWLRYLSEYDRLLSRFRSQAVSLLEIGVQNGGSLEIWSGYLPAASAIVGCDINPDCTELRFDDPRIGVFVGDANSDQAQEFVQSRSPLLDIIIDDGSHTSADIIRSFARYFPLVADGGVYIAEDLHCSYWGEFGGGLFAPLSSIAFFKSLVDSVNYDHWGLVRDRVSILNGFISEYDLALTAETLAQIHSIEFFDSVCVIRKEKPSHNGLGIRFVAGLDESVQPGLPKGEVCLAYVQATNFWSALERSPSEQFVAQLEEIAELNQSVTDKQAEIDGLNQTVLASEKEADDLDFAVSESQGEIVELTRALTDRDLIIESIGLRIGEFETSVKSYQNSLTDRDLIIESLGLRIGEFETSVKSYQNSLSWRITRPFRWIGGLFSAK